MEKLKKLFLDIANSVPNHSETKIEQLTARAWKKDLISTMQEYFTEQLEDTTNTITVQKVNGGFTIVVDNASVGLLCFDVDVKLKDLRFDINEELDEYEFKLNEKLEKAKTEAKQKSNKIARDIADREQKKNG